MEEFQPALSAILQHFGITVARTQRQDQWYKRLHHRWTESQQDHKRDLLVLSPKESKGVWAPKVLSLALGFRRDIEHAATTETLRVQNQLPVSDDKLFPDAAFDIPAMLASDEKNIWTPYTQKRAFWVSSTAMDRARATRALLERGQLAPLMHLAKESPAYVRDVSFVRGRNSRSGHLDNGWSVLINEILQALLFLGTLKTFPDRLLQQSEYRNWLPYGSFMNRETAASRFVDAMTQRGAGLQIEHDTKRCFRTLIHIEALHRTCGLGEIAWEDHICDAFLYYVGFEAWNRARAGDSYLGCGLNTPKGAKWLRTGLRDDEFDIQETAAVNPGTTDPPLLRGPKQESSPVCEDSDDDEIRTLGALEEEETVYGLKRSQKYRPKLKSQT